MSKVRSRLARYNTICCDQVMPVPVIPVCAVSCCIPTPICEYKQPDCYIPPPPQGCNPPQEAIENAQLEAPIKSSPIKVPCYNPYLPNPPTGTILTISGNVIPDGYLEANGDEISRAVYSGLFSIIGSFYGDGNGSSTFNLPNISCQQINDCVVRYIIKT